MAITALHAKICRSSPRSDKYRGDQVQQALAPLVRPEGCFSSKRGAECCMWPSVSTYLYASVSPVFRIATTGPAVTNHSRCLLLVEFIAHHMFRLIKYYYM